MNIEILINNLMEFYHVNSITKLAKKLKTSQSTISGWRSRNAIGALTSTVASVDEEALSHIFGSSVDNSRGSQHTVNATSNNANLIPNFILDELNALFKRASGNENDLIDAIDDFIASQKKIYRQGNTGVDNTIANIKEQHIHLKTDQQILRKVHIIALGKTVEINEEALIMDKYTKDSEFSKGAVTHHGFRVDIDKIDIGKLETEKLKMELKIAEEYNNTSLVGYIIDE